MPELPEVETIKLGLQKYLVGKKIEAVEVKLKRIFSGDVKEITGAKIVGVRRFGKGLVIDLDNKYSIAVHIKMTGQLIYQDETLSKKVRLSRVKVGETLPNIWTHAIFKLKNQKSNLKNKSAFLYYNDQRQFGWIKIVETENLNSIPFLRNLGPEPPVAKAMEGQALLTLNLFKKNIISSKVPIKVAIMDQQKISGVGNIYANDALFDSKIDPRRKANNLSEKELGKLYLSIIKVLKKGIETGGASEFHFVNALGEAGEYQNHFLIYGKKSEPCKNCKQPIKKITLAGRGTYFCENCQK